MLHASNHTILPSRGGISGLAKVGFLGFALWWAWWDMFRVADSHIIPIVDEGPATDLGRLGVAIGIWLGAFLLWRASSRIRMLCLHRSWLVGSVIAATALSAYLYLPLFGVLVPGAFLARLFLGVAGSLLFFAWFEFYSTDSVSSPAVLVPLCLIVDAVILALFVVAHFFAPYEVLAVAHMALLPLSLLLLFRSLPSSAAEATAPFGDASVRPEIKLPVKLMMALVVFGVAFGFVLNVSPDFFDDSLSEHGALVLEIVGMVLGALLFLMLGRRGSEKRGSFLSLRWVAAPFMVLSLLSLLTVAGFSPAVTKMLLWMGYEYLDLIMMVVYIRMARDLGILPLNVNAQGQSADTFGIMVGMLAGVAFGTVSANLNQMAVSILVTVLVMVVMMVTLLVMSDRDISTFWGLMKKAPKGVETARRQQSDQFRKFGEHFGLTAREREIAEMLVRQQRPVLIAETLVISPETVRSHTSRIYTKCGCHSQVELVKAYRSFVGESYVRNGEE